MARMWRQRPTSRSRARMSHHYILGDPGHTAANSDGQPWSGDYVFNGGNVVLDLLRNFFLESGARTHKARCYQMTTNPTAPTMIGYLLVRGGVNAAAYGRAPEKLTGVKMTKLLPISNIDNTKFPEARRREERGERTKLYRFSPNDFRTLPAIWSGTADWADGAPLQVVDGHPPAGGAIPEGSSHQAGFAPDYEPGEIFEIAQRLMKSM